MSDTVWVRLGAVVVGLGLWFIPVSDAPPLRSGAYVQNVTPTSAVIARIEPSARRLRVRVVGPSGREHTASSLARRRHALEVSGLEAGTRYAFEVLAGSTVVDRGSFKTASVDDHAPVRFAVLGDSGKQPFWVWTQESAFGYPIAEAAFLPSPGSTVQVAEQVLAAQPDFWLHVGDLVYPKGQQRHYGPGFFQPFAELLRHSPCYPVLGNHDALTDGGRPLFQNFVLPTNDITGDERCYTFANGPVRVIALDLNAGFGPGHPALRFLQSVCETASEPWLVVINHYPVDSAYRPGPPDPALVKHFLGTLERYRVDVLAAGHDHNYQRFGSPPGLVQVVTGGGGKSLYEIVRRPPGLVTAVSAFHSCQVDVDGLRLTWTALDIDGGQPDQFTIDKARAIRAGDWQLDPANPRDRRIKALLK